VTFGVIGLALALIGAFADGARAAEPSQRTACRSTVTWGLTSAGERVAGLDSAVAWAYGQVAAASGVEAHQGDTNTVEFSHVGLAERLQGSTEVPGVSTRESWRDDREILVHTHDFDDASASQIRQTALRDVLSDLGVKAPTSTATGLSAADRKALSARCAKPAPAATASASPTTTAGAGDVPETAAAPIAAPDRATAAAVSVSGPTRWGVLALAGVTALGVVGMWVPWKGAPLPHFKRRGGSH
jgi:hypothetical protein